MHSKEMGMMMMTRGDGGGSTAPRAVSRGIDQDEPGTILTEGAYNMPVEGSRTWGMYVCLCVCHALCIEGFFAITSRSRHQPNTLLPSIVQRVGACSLKCRF